MAVADVRALSHPDWLRRMNLFADAVGDARLVVGLDPEELLDGARQATGLDDLGAAEWPGWEEGFRRLLTAIDDEAQLHLVGRLLTRAEALRVFETWLRLQAHWRAAPAVAGEVVEAPVFVVGPPRTGTSILLELLALDPALRAPLAWEALHPLPLESGGDRVEVAESEQELWADLHPEFLTMHELASDLPCECVHFLALDPLGPYWSMLYDTPTFTAWQLEHIDDLARVYRLHRRFLQTLQAGDGDRRRWLLKSPYHLGTLPQLFTEYPDAKVVHTHRDPRRFLASLVSTLSALRFMRSDAVDVDALAGAMLLAYSMFLDTSMAQRADGSLPADGIVDSHYLDLMADPVAQLRRIYDELDLDWPAGHDRRIRDYLAAKPKAAHGAHRYTLADVGLDEDEVRKTFAGYVANYGITEE
jgi:hypothetical protein